MRRDLELIRKLMLAIEAHPESVAPGSVEVPGYDEDVVAYHRWLLVDAGLADGSEVTDMQSTTRDALVYSLNTAGHDFLDVARSDRVWKGAMQRVAAAGGGVALGVLADLLKDHAKKLLGL